MIQYPVRYDAEDESVQGADFVVIAHPFIGIGFSKEAKHRIGEEIAEALNYRQAVHQEVDRNIPQPQPSVRISATTGIMPPEIMSKMNKLETTRFTRLSRKIRKAVEKFSKKYGGTLPPSP